MAQSKTNIAYKHPNIPQRKLIDKMLTLHITQKDSGKCHGFVGGAIYFALLRTKEEFNDYILSCNSNEGTSLSRKDQTFLKKIAFVHSPKKGSNSQKTQRTSIIRRMQFEFEKTDIDDLTFLEVENEITSGAKISRLFSFIDAKEALTELRKAILHFKETNKLLPEVCFRLGNSNHAIACVYNPNEDIWYYMDPNAMPFNPIQGWMTFELSKHVFAGFGINSSKGRDTKSSAIGFQFYTVEKDAKCIQQITERWQESDVMQRTNGPFQTELRDNKDTSWLEIAVRTRDYESLAKILEEMQSHIDKKQPCKIDRLDRVLAMMMKNSAPIDLIEETIKLCDNSAIENVTSLFISPESQDTFEKLYSLLPKEKQKSALMVSIHSAFKLNLYEYAYKQLEKLVILYSNKNEHQKILIDILTSELLSAMSSNSPSSINWLCEFINKNDLVQDMTNHVIEQRKDAKNNINLKNKLTIIKSLFIKENLENLYSFIPHLYSNANKEELIFTLNFIEKKYGIVEKNYALSLLLDVIKSNNSLNIVLPQLFSNSTNTAFERENKIQTLLSQMIATKNEEVITMLFESGANPFNKLKIDRLTYISHWTLAFNQGNEFAQWMLSTYLTKSPNPQKNQHALSELLLLGIEKEDVSFIEILTEEIFDLNNNAHIETVKNIIETNFFIADTIEELLSSLLSDKNENSTKEEEEEDDEDDLIIRIESSDEEQYKYSSDEDSGSEEGTLIGLSLFKHNPNIKITNRTEELDYGN